MRIIDEPESIPFPAKRGRESLERENWLLDDAWHASLAGDMFPITRTINRCRAAVSAKYGEDCARISVVVEVSAGKIPRATMTLRLIAKAGARFKEGSATIVLAPELATIYSGRARHSYNAHRPDSEESHAFLWALENDLLEFFSRAVGQ